MSDLYSVRRLSTSTYRFVKFDDLLNPVATYSVVDCGWHTQCNCPRSNFPSCRHREMLPVFFRSRAVDTGKFYDFDHKRWAPALPL